MDRKTWLAVGLSILGIVLWQWYYNVTYGPYLQQQEEARVRAVAEAAALAAANPADPTVAPTATATATPTPAPTPVPAAMVAARSETISGGDGADFEFTSDAGGIETAILLLHIGENSEAVGLNRDARLPIGALGFEPGKPLGGFTMDTAPGGERIVFSKTEPDGLQIEKSFVISKDDKDAPYVVGLDVTFRNPGATPLSRAGYFVSAGGAMPIHENDMPIYTRFDWDRDGKMKSIDVNWFGGSSIPLVGIQLRSPQATYAETAESVDWAAVTSQYFATIVSVKREDLTATTPTGQTVWAQRFAVPNGNGKQIYGMQGGLGMPGFELPAGESRTTRFEIYAGPKDLARLRDLGNNQEAVMNFGMFGFVSKFLLWAMVSLNGFFNSYAWSIIVLTLLIKTALWPLQNKATQSMKRMALLSPKMTELREKYKDDPTKMNEELMKLYRDYGVNPFSGCLPMLIQIPIFFGFYSMLGSAIELRNSSFLWVADLSQPDTVGHFLGFPINLLPLLMAGTMVWQMAITPKTGDKNQQRILMFMPIIFVVFAYNFASALSLYWTTQNIFSIFQLYLTRNQPLPTLEKRVAPAKSKGTTPAKKKRQKRSLP